MLIKIFLKQKRILTCAVKFFKSNHEENQPEPPPACQLPPPAPVLRPPISPIQLLADETPPLPEPVLFDDPKPGGGPRGALLPDHKSAAEDGIDFGIGVESDHVLFGLGFELQIEILVLNPVFFSSNNYFKMYLEKFGCPAGLKLQVEFERLMG